MHRSWMDLIFFPPSSSSFSTFLNVLANLLSPLLPPLFQPATIITAPVDICSGALLFLFVCMPQSSIAGSSVHSAITLNKGSVELAA